MDILFVQVDEMEALRHKLEECQMKSLTSLLKDMPRKEGHMKMTYRS
jgi:hypothetical protein